MDDFFPSPHGIGHFGVNDVPHDIEGFVADVQPLSDGFYPNTIELSSVDFFQVEIFQITFLHQLVSLKMQNHLVVVKLKLNFLW